MIVSPIVKCLKNSPIGWLGGKTRLRTTIINVLPQHVAYIEVFGGSCTIFFGKSPSRIEIINDIDGELVNLMKVISGTYFDEKVRQEFIGYVRDMPASRKAFQEWQKWLNAGVKGDTSDLDNLNPAQRAFVFYYCTKKGFSSVAAGGYEASPFTGSRYNQKTNFDQFTKRFRDNNVQIECLPFDILIEKYNRPGAKSMFVADPPYWIANGTNYYRFVFDKDDHLKFKECCDKIDQKKNYFLVTYDDVPEIIDLYQNYYIYRTDPIIYRAANESNDREIEKTELFITNYDIINIVSKNRIVHGKSGEKILEDLYADDEVVAGDGRIEIKDHVGLERIR